MKKLITNFALLFVCLCANAYDFKDGNLYYIVTDASALTVAVVKGDAPYSGDIVIPAVVNYKNRELKVTSIKDNAFQESGITSMEFSPNMTSLNDDCSFAGCEQLSKVVIPSSVKSMRNIFWGCSALKEVVFQDGTNDLKFYYSHQSQFFADSPIEKLYIGRNIDAWNPSTFKMFGNLSHLTEVTIGPDVTVIEECCFSGASNLEEIIIPGNVQKICEMAFNGCSSLKSLKFLDGNTIIQMANGTYGSNYFTSCQSVEYLYLGREFKFSYLYDGFTTLNMTKVDIGKSIQAIPALGSSKLVSIFIPSNINSIGGFSRCNELREVVVDNPTPPSVTGYQGFSTETLVHGTLFVPKEAISTYQKTDVWKDFWNIVEEGQGGQVMPEQCATPTIEFKNKKLLYFCDTEGAICHSTIKCNDAKSYDGNEIKLGATYDISVYATAEGFTQSEVINATLYWLDATLDPLGVQAVHANTRGILVQHSNGFLTVSGLENYEKVYFYDITGKLLGEPIAYSGEASCYVGASTTLVIVKIGNESIKVVL